MANSKINTLSDKIEIELAEGFHLYVYEDIVPIAPQWDKLNKKGILNSSQFLQSVQHACPQQLKQYYGILSHSSQEFGSLLFQVKRFNLAEALDIHTHSDKFWDRLVVRIKQTISRLVDHDLLILGNVLLTGQYGINVDDSMDLSKQLNLLEDSMERFSQYMNKNKQGNIQSILVKDFKLEEHKEVKLAGFTEFSVDPYMFLDLRWDNFELYLADLKSKYRVRYKRAVKKGSGIEVRTFNAEELNKFEDQIYSLYKQISTNVTFNLFDLAPNYFTSLKEHLGDKVEIKGLFLEEKLIAFYSLILDKEHQELDAHFLGYDMAVNKSKQSYLNILYFILNDAIQLKVKKINLSRTAMEIKSSVGAIGENLFLLLKHRRPLINKIMHRFLMSYVPDNEWLPRQPFKN